MRSDVPFSNLKAQYGLGGWNSGVIITVWQIVGHGFFLGESPAADQKPAEEKNERFLHRIDVVVK